MSHCPLCQHKEVAPYFQEPKREYLQCQCCKLVFVPERFHLSAESEKGYYDLHENHPEDPGYRQFLRRIFEPVSCAIPPGSSGLDFGCGPGPTLSLMFEEAGHKMALYDLYYFPQSEALQRQYDFVVCSEVVEHLRTPAPTLDQLISCLKPGGTLGIMTKRVIDQQAFSRWHYKNDPTHILFFSEATFQWLAEHYKLQLSFPAKDVALLQS